MPTCTNHCSNTAFLSFVLMLISYFDGNGKCNNGLRVLRSNFQGEKQTNIQNYVDQL